MTQFPKFQRHNFVIAFILILTFLVYSPALFHQFLNLDDPGRITNNPLIRSLSPENIFSIFTSVVEKAYMPLTIFSFALEYHCVGLNPFLYHLNNILLHCAVVFLVFRVGMSLGLREKGACIAAFIFALHPMHVEAVAWATERKDVLYSVFYLGAVLAYLNYLKTNKKSAYGISLLLAFLSMLSKSMALSLPLILLACDWFTQGTVKRKDWINKIPYVFFIALLSLITYLQSADLVTQNLGANPLFRFWAAAFYLKKFFWPIILVPHYVPPLPVEILHFEYWSSVFIVTASVILFAVYRNRWLRLSLLWFILSIFFLLNFDYPRFMQTVADRYMYLPSAGFCFFIGYAIEKVWEQKILSPAIQRVALAGLIGVALFLSVKTFFQVRIWHDSFSLWNYTAQHSPKSFWAYNHRGRIFDRRGHFNRALADYKESIRLNPYYAKSYFNLASLLERQGDIRQAVENYSKAIALNPKYKEAFNNRGLLLQKMGDNASALLDFENAIAVDPQYVLAYANRGALFLQIGEVKSALEDCHIALKLSGSNSQVRSICSQVVLGHTP